MNPLRRHPSVPAPRPPRNRGRNRAASCLLGALLPILLLVAPPAVAAPPVHTYSLLPGVVAQVHDDGGLWIGTGVGRDALLEVIPVGATMRRGRSRDITPFAATTQDGAVGGHRGFSSQRDDDGDGRVDEDPLNGRDDDGDGRRDEDFAAIGDDMVVVEGRQGGHFEYYHWNAAHLRSLVFLSAGLENGRCRVALPGGTWREELVSSRGHDLAGRPTTARTTAFVGRAAGDADPCEPGSGPWFGVVMLDPGPDSRVVLDGGQLEIHLTAAAEPVAVATARSRLQLDRLLNEAVRVQRGVVDRLTGEQAPWIAPALCARCRLATIPVFEWRRDEDRRLVLSTRLEASDVGAVDPDLFRLDGTGLGSPEEIRWLPDTRSGRVRGEVLAWDCAGDRPEAGPWSVLTEAFEHGASGRVEFVFPAGERIDRLGPASVVDGVFSDGRSFQAELRSAAVLALTNDPAPNTSPDLVPATPAPDQAQVLEKSDHTPALAPGLLEGFPNPFRETIQLRFQVPATMGEAFVWESDKDAPAGLDPYAAIPWKGGQPQVSVKIYSINGQELVTLFSGTMGPGQSIVRWSGTDSYGRQVSSGTYFCKLQMDDWSVTRRLVFLR